MAIARGSGTEIIRSAHFYNHDSTGRIVIVGKQHHIYTVLSVICYATAVNSAGNYLRMYVTGYDSKGGTTDEQIEIFRVDFNALETFVWNDKFSFNGYEPVNFTGPMDDATKQDAIADQGGSVVQSLGMDSEHADDNFTVMLSFLDQNNE